MGLVFKHDDSQYIPLSELGTGITQVVILLVRLIRKREDNVIVFMEEPEAHLHPGLLRCFFEQLRHFPNAQVIIGTHSNVAIDSLREGDRLFRFRQLENGACVARRCEGVVEQHQLLDALGVSGSTILQTNCAIWVEGPSDRLYIRRWLEIACKQKGVTFQEHADYGFLFYGGSILKHFGFEDRGGEDVIRMLKVNRFSAIIMDRDGDPASETLELTPAKKRILEECQSDPKHRLASLTDGWEIESDVPQQVLMSAVAELLGIDAEQLRGFTLTHKKPFEQEIADRLQLEGDKKSAAKRKMNDKVRLSTKVLAAWGENEQRQPPAYINQLVELIIRSRALGEL